MKLKKIITAAAVTLAVSLTATAFGFVIADNYSASDPLISKSYLDQVFLKQVTDYVDSKLSLLSASSPEATDTTAQPAAKDITYEIITLTKGQTLLAKGSLELILRPGSSATVVSHIPENGIANLTSGSELYNGTELPINAYCLIPRGDGRGILCTSDTAYIMVRGSYEIK